MAHGADVKRGHEQIPQSWDETNLKKFLLGLMQKGFRRGQANRLYHRKLRGKHRLHSSHFGTFSPVKPL